MWKRETWTITGPYSLAAVSPILELSPAEDDPADVAASMPEDACRGSSIGYGMPVENGDGMAEVDDSATIVHPTTE